LRERWDHVIKGRALHVRKGKDDQGEESCGFFHVKEWWRAGEREERA
jgi:hypothetical protein